MEKKFREFFKSYMYFGIIIILVVIALIFLPMFDSSGKIGISIPETTLGWISYIVIRCLVGVISYLIFISFDEQGKVNIRNDERYKNAYMKLYTSKDKNYIPMSPTQYKLKTRGVKALTTAISSIGLGFIIIECTLTYNYNILLAYGVTIALSVIVGVFEMEKTANWWVEEFPLWVDYHIDEIKKQESVKTEDKECNKECLDLETKNLEI